TSDTGIQAAIREHDFLAPVFAQYPIEVASAQGVWLTSSRGERVLDLYGGHAVAGLGYAHPAWTAALARQAEACQFQSNAVAMRIRAQAARRLVRFSRLPFASAFLVNSGAEANENALKVALRMTGRAHVAAIEGGFHGRTAQPFAANLYGVRPDMLTTAKALGNGFPCAALLFSPLVAASLKPESLGTTFGGGPLACAAIAAVIAAIKTERLLERVRRIGAYIRETCIVGPVVAHQGAGLLVGLRTTRPAREIQAELLECCILTGTANDPHILRLLPAFILEEQHVDMLRDALRDLPP